MSFREVSLRGLLLLAVLHAAVVRERMNGKQKGHGRNLATSPPYPARSELRGRHAHYSPVRFCDTPQLTTH